MSTAVAGLQAVFGADTSGLQAGINQAKGGLTGLSGQLTSLGGQFTGLGSQVTVLTAGITAGLGYSINSAMEFESSMTNVGAVLGKSQTEMAGLNAQILEMGGNSLAGPQATAQAFYDIVGGVADATQHIPILTAAMATAEAGAANLQGTTAALVSTMNSYGMSAQQVGYASDVMTNLVAKGVGTMDEFAASLPQVTGLAASMGISFDELSGDMAYLTTQGYSASQSATLLKSMMTTMMNPTKDLQGAINDLGYSSGEAMIEALGLSGAYGLLASSGDGINGIVTNVEALQGATVLGTQKAEEFGQNFSGVMTDAQQHTYDLIEATEGLDAAQGYLRNLGIGYENATDKARRLQLESTAAKFGLLKSKVSELSIEVGGVLLPILENLLDKTTPIIEDVMTWAEANPDLAGGILAMAAGLAILGPVLMVAGTGLTVLGTVAGLVLSPIGILAIAIGGAYLTNFLGFGDAVDSAATSLKAFAGGAMEAFNAGGLEGLGQFIVDGLESAVAKVPGIAANIVTELMKPENWANAKDTLGVILTEIGNAELKFADFVLNEIATPTITELKKPENWANAGEVMAVILAEMGNGQADVTSFAINSIVVPVTGTLTNPATWIAAQGFVSTLLTQATEGATTIGSLIESGIITPITTKMTDPESWKGAGEWLGGLLKSGIEGGIDIVGWVNTNILSPLWAALSGGGESGGASAGDSAMSGLMNSALGGGGGGALQGLLEGALGGGEEGGAGQSFAMSLINSIGNALGNPENWQTVKELAGSFFSGFFEGLGVTPGDASGLIKSAIIDPIKDALVNASADLHNAFASAINDAVPDSISISLPIPEGTPDALISALGIPQSLSMSIPNPIQMRASGGPVSSGDPYIVGEMGPELFVPNSSGGIVPNHALGGGAGSGMTITGTINLYGITDVEAMYNALLNVDQNQARPAFTGGY